MATTYTKPDVEVLQEFKNLTPPVNLAALQTVIVGPSFKKIKDTDAESTKLQIGQYTRGERFSEPFPELPSGSKIDYDSLKITISNYSGEHEIAKSVIRLDGNSGKISEIGDSTVTFIDNNADFSVVFVPEDDDDNPDNNPDNDADFVCFEVDGTYRYFEVQQVVDNHTLILDNPDEYIYEVQEDISYSIGTFGWYLDSEDNDRVIITTRLSHNGVVYMSGRAMRTDYTDKLISIGSVEDLEEIFGEGEVTLENPLAYGMKLVLPYLGTSEVVTGVMVESDDVIGYQKAFEFLESQEVYCIVPLTTNPIVHQMLKEHVLAMSDVSEKRERIGLINGEKIYRNIKSGFLGRKDKTTGIYDFAKGTITNSGKELSDSVSYQRKAFTVTEESEVGQAQEFVPASRANRAVIYYRAYQSGVDSIQYVLEGDTDPVDVEMNEDGYGVVPVQSGKSISKFIFTPGAVSEKSCVINCFYTESAQPNASYAYGVVADGAISLSNPDVAIPNQTRRCLKIRAYQNGQLMTENNSYRGVALPVKLTVQCKNETSSREIAFSGTHTFEKEIQSISLANNGDQSAPDSFAVDIMMLSNGGTYKLDAFKDEYATFLSDNIDPSAKDELVIIDKSVVDEDTYSGYKETRYQISEVVEENELRIDSKYDAATDSFVSATFIDAEEDVYYRVESKIISSKNELAKMYAANSESFGTRRITNIFAPAVGVSDDSSTTVMVPGYYFACSYAGAIQAYQPQRGFTNLSFAGFTKVSGTNDYFSESQLDKIASGGTTVVIQPNVTSALTVRHQLTTDMSSVENRELSVTKDIDYMAKMARETYRPYIGKYVINDATLDLLYKLGSSLVSKWIDDGNALPGTAVDKFAVDENQIDKVYACFNIKVPIPLNYIRLIFVI